MVTQLEITLPTFKRGFHIITDLITKKLDNLPEQGLVNIFIKHTSAAITLNENADPSVLYDFENFMNKLIPDGDSIFTHTYEGDDDIS
jgi:secondary thiamine-phosphate synthase enzyme